MLNDKLSKDLCDEINRDCYYRVLKYKRQKPEDYHEIKWNGLRRKWSLLLRHHLL